MGSFQFSDTCLLLITYILLYNVTWDRKEFRQNMIIYTIVILNT